jgi:hypothetical protein
MHLFLPECLFGAPTASHCSLGYLKCAITAKRLGHGAHLTSSFVRRRSNSTSDGGRISALGERVIAEVESGAWRREAAEEFEVSASTAIIVKCFRETGRCRQQNSDPIRLYKWPLGRYLTEATGLQYPATAI